MELIDIYNAQGHPTGTVRERGKPLNSGEYVMAVGVWVTDSENQILLTQRSLEKSFAPGKWENTGGHVRAGEECSAAMARELEDRSASNNTRIFRRLLVQFSDDLLISQVDVSLCYGEQDER